MQNRKKILLLSGVLFLLPRPNDSLLFLLLFPHFKMFEFLMMMQWVDFLIFLAENLFFLFVDPRSLLPPQSPWKQAKQASLKGDCWEIFCQLIFEPGTAIHRLSSGRLPQRYAGQLSWVGLPGWVGRGWVPVCVRAHSVHQNGFDRII